MNIALTSFSQLIKICFDALKLQLHPTNFLTDQINGRIIERSLLNVERNILEQILGDVLLEFSDDCLHVIQEDALELISVPSLGISCFLIDVSSIEHFIAFINIVHQFDFDQRHALHFAIRILLLMRIPSLHRLLLHEHLPKPLHIIWIDIPSLKQHLLLITMHHSINIRLRLQVLCLFFLRFLFEARSIFPFVLLAAIVLLVVVNVRVHVASDLSEEEVCTDEGFSFKGVRV